MRGTRVRVWHPDSSGAHFVVYRPWWRRKRRPFGTLHEFELYWKWAHSAIYDVRRAPVVTLEKP